VLPQAVVQHTESEKANSKKICLPGIVCRVERRGDVWGMIKEGGRSGFNYRVAWRHRGFRIRVRREMHAPDLNWYRILHAIPGQRIQN